MPKLKTLSRLLVPVALMALAACQTPHQPGSSTASTGTSDHANGSCRRGRCFGAGSRSPNNGTFDDIFGRYQASSRLGRNPA